MCFSATASFTAGVVLSSTGVVVLTKVKNKKEIPLALIPLLFGIQQLIEGFVWLSLGWNNPTLNSVMSHAFFWFSNIWWPLFIPLAVLCIETVLWRRKLISFFEFLGVIVAGFFFSFFLDSSIVGAVKNHCIVYTYPTAHFAPIVILYVIATCGSLLASSKKTINLLGVLVLAFFFIAYAFYTEALVSVWCFFAAILSLVIYVYFDRRR